jgi:hypothetical protein
MAKVNATIARITLNGVELQGGVDFGPLPDVTVLATVATPEQQAQRVYPEVRFGYRRPRQPKVRRRGMPPGLSLAERREILRVRWVTRKARTLPTPAWITGAIK